MHSSSILGLAGVVALASATAIPMQHAHHHHHQRALDYVWVTETAEEVVTVPVTQTVWLEAGETAPAQGQFQRPTFTSHIQHTVTAPFPSPESSTYVAPTSSEESTTYVAPTTTSSTSEYVPPPAPTTSTTSEYVPPPAPTTPTTTSTSEYVAPATSAYVAPTTEASTAAAVAPTSVWTSSAASAQSSAASSGSSSGLSSGVAAAGTSYTGDLTWYDVGLGACGLTSTPDQHIVAIAESIFDDPAYATANPNANPLCGKTVTITGVNGSPYTATVVDRCTGCKAADLDLSEDFFNLVTNNGDGRVHNMKWSFN